MGTSQSYLQGCKWIRLKKTVVSSSSFEYTAGRYDQFYLTQIKSNQFIYGQGTRIKLPSIPDRIAI